MKNSNDFTNNNINHWYLIFYCKIWFFLEKKREFLWEIVEISAKETRVIDFFPLLTSVDYVLHT